MDATPPLAASEVIPSPRPVRGDVERYLVRVGKEHHRFVAALAEANRDLGSVGQLAKMASVQKRLTQEFLDAQRAILKRRAETDAEVADIVAAADVEAALVLRSARARARIAAGPPLPPPVAGSWPAPLVGRPVPRVRPIDELASAEASESLARLIDGAFESAEPDGEVARRQLRDLLDSWWEAEKQEAKAAADDATARAAMTIHTAKIEAGEIARFVPPTTTPLDIEPYRHQPPAALASPMVRALDETDHAHLDDVLAHLLDELDTDANAPSLPETPRSADRDDVALEDLFGAPPGGTAVAPSLPAPTDSLNDRSDAPQEAFDRFWTAFGGAGPRRWMYPQFLLPAVAVVSVLALVLAVVG